MAVYSVAQAKAHFSRLIDEVEAGEVVEITRRGRAVACVLPRRTVQDLLPSLERLRAGLPNQKTPSVSAIRQMREQERF
jgi:prevent-host-death family protein